MRSLIAVLSCLMVCCAQHAFAEAKKRDPENIVPLPTQLEIEAPAAALPASIARFHGAWIGAWGDEMRHILVVERITANGQAQVISAVGDSASFGVTRNWERAKATIEGEKLIIQYPHETDTYEFDGADRLFATATRKSGQTTPGFLKRTDATNLRSPVQVAEVPWPGERIRVPHLTVKTDDGSRGIQLEATLYRPQGSQPAHLAIINHGSDIGRDQLKSFSFYAEARWLLEKGYAVLVLMRRGRGQSEGVYGEDTYAYDRSGRIIDTTSGIMEGVEDLQSAIAHGRGFDFVRPGPVLLVGQSRGGFLSVIYAGLRPQEVMAVINIAGGWVASGPFETLAKPFFERAGRGAGASVPQLWVYAEKDSFYGEALIRANYNAFTAAGGSARFEFYRDVAGDGHRIRQFPGRWRPAADQFVEALSGRRP
jgi:dienelactone hydrolase